MDSITNESESSSGEIREERKARVLCSKALKNEQVDFFRYVLIPAVVLTVLLVLLKQWQTRKKKKSCCPLDVVWPVDIIGERQCRFPYVAAFNISAWSFIIMLIGGQSPLNFKVIAPLSSLMKLLTCILLGFIFYPLFAAISSKHAIGYALGALYIWMLTGVFFFFNYPCQDPLLIVVVCDSLQMIPCLLWMLYLCIYFPYKIIKSIQARRNYDTVDSNICEAKTFAHKYVRRLINVKDASPVPYRVSYGAKGGCVEKITKRFFAKVYAPIEGFRYPISMLTATTVSMLLVWSASLEVLQFYNELLIMGKGAIPLFFSPSTTEKLTNNTLIDALEETKFFKKALIWWESMQAATYLSFVLAFVLIVASMLLTLRNYRNNLLQYYRGRVVDLPSVGRSKPRSIVASSAKYVGYQIAYSMWGFVVQAILLLLICGYVTYIVVSLVIFKDHEMFLWLLSLFGPMFAYIYGIYIIQQLLVHFIFLQKDEHGSRVLAISRLLCFFNFQYFMVFANSAVGLVSCLLRIIKSVIFGAFTLNRLDISSFSRTFEHKDAGFNAYNCLLALENVQTNPTLTTLVDLLWQSIEKADGQQGKQLNVMVPLNQDKHSAKIGQSDVAKRKKVIRNKWQVALTLFNNPYLKHYRKKDIENQTAGSFAEVVQLANLEMALLANRRLSSASASVIIKKTKNSGERFPDSSDSALLA